MGDWTSQNWTKRDGRNNQEEEQQQQQQEKKATYKTAAELAVKNIGAQFTHLYIPSLCKEFFVMRHNIIKGLLLQDWGFRLG